MGVKISGPINLGAVIGGFLAGPLGVSSANATQARFEPIAGFSLTAANIDVGKTGLSGGFQIPIGPFSFTPITVNSQNQVSSSLSVDAGIESEGFDFTFGSASITISGEGK